MNSAQWLTLRQAHTRLAELNVDIQTVRAWADQKRFGDVRRTPGGHRRIRAAAVDDMLAKWRADQPAEQPAEGEPQ